MTTAQTSVKDIALIASMTVEAFLRKVKGELGDELPQVHTWTAETQVDNESVDQIFTWLGLDEERNLKTVSPSAITKVDEAVKEAKLKVVEILKIQQQQAIEELKAQTQATGVATGVNMGLQFFDSMVQGFAVTTDAFIEETWGVYDDQMKEIDSTAIKIASNVGKQLGKATVRQQKAKQRIKDLQEQVNKLLS